VSAVDAASWVDDLYRRAVESPSDIDDRALADWMFEAAELLGRPDKATARVLRRVVRDGRKLAAYWSQRDGAALPDWRNGVDEALGSRGWQPQLDLVSAALEEAPDPGLFEEMRARFRAVHFQPWMEGIGYEEWLEQRERMADGA
jgi:hypothetical protein